MEKHCGNCKYRTFPVNDKFKTYGYCTREGVKSATFRADIWRDSLTVIVEDKIPNGEVPACLNVQTYYNGECPYKEENYE